MTRTYRIALLLGLVAVAAESPALAFDRIQPPEVGVGKRASLAGSLASTLFGPSDVVRGGFSLPTPFEAPKERGPLMAPVFPTYNPDNGISVWGMGFSSTLALTRSRVTGSLAYDFTKGDELTSPFGRLTRGADGNFYPVGLEAKVRVVASGNTFIAYQPDGSVWTFGGAASVTTPKGVYAWYLTSIKDAVGHGATLTYASNASGNLFLTQVDYGGRATPLYRITVAYETVGTIDSLGAPQPRFTDYRAGAPLTLDRRVKTVTVLAKSAATGAYAERYHYTLGYAEEAVGAAFYLSEIDTTYASGATLPPVKYTYNLKGAGYDTATMKEVPQLTALFTSLGVDEGVIQSSRAAVTDADQDGNADLEVGDNARTLISQKGSGTAADPLHFDVTTVPMTSAPACTTATQVGCAFDPCRTVGDPDTLLAPRLLARLTPNDPTVHVVSAVYSSDLDQTALNVCSRDGVRTAIQNVAGNWEQSQFVRFVDVNNDHMPDLVKMQYGSYTVLPNLSQVSPTGAVTYAWGAPIYGALLDTSGNPLSPDATWVSDVSGDGIPDLVAQAGDALLVWHGLGNFQFTSSAEEFLFFNEDGSQFYGFANYSIIPADLNKDGLVDYFVTNAPGDTADSRFVSYFTNVGGQFVRTPMNALDTLPYTASPPVIASLDGQGNTSITVTDSGSAYSVTLDGPETGLMATADDGKGTVLAFQYARGPASPGVRHRYALLSSMTVQGSGYDTIGYDYQYAQPTLHSTGLFLVGFNQVTRREGALPAAPLGTNTSTFLNADAWSGLLSANRQADVRVPDAMKIEARQYNPATFQGIPYERLASSTSGWSSADGTKRAVDVTTFDSYTADFCPSQTTLTTAGHGTLVTQTTRATPANFVNALHCLEGDVVQIGTHADATLNFREERLLARNAAGLVTQSSLLGAAGPLVEEQVVYDADNDPLTITIPGKGTSTIGYDPATKLFSSVTHPDGVVASMTRDPVTDVALAVKTNRGGAAWTDHAGYDSLGRLATHWSDIDGSSALAPHERYVYSYASTNHPATVTLSTLVDLATGSYRQTNELYTAAEEKIGTAQLHDSGWVLDGFLARSRAQREQDGFQVATQPATASFATIDYATLLAGAPSKITTVDGTTLDDATSATTTTRLHVDVTKATATSVSVTPAGQLSRTTLVNGTNAVTTLLDPTGKLQLAFIDEAQSTYGYAFDALGRLRDVALPDGTHHHVTYDAYGRESEIVRDGVARIDNSFVALGAGTTDMVLKRTFSSAPAAPAASIPERSIGWSYDGAGRKLVETHTDLTSGAAKAFTYYYDGATAAAPTTRSLLGLLSGVSGVGYTKSFLYRADGKPTHREVAIAGFRTIDTDFAYREDSTVRDETITVKDPTGKVLETSAHHQDVDSFGRPSKTSVNGAALATTSYDTLGRPATTSFATGDSVSFAYDPLTRGAIGFDETRAEAGAWAGVASTRVKRNNRGFVGQELLGVGPSSVLRSYTYSPEGFLTLAVDGVPQ